MLLLEEESQLLHDTAARFLTKHVNGGTRHPTALAKNLGFDPALWRQMASMGWTAIPFPSQYGGLDGSLHQVAVLIEQFGRKRYLSPYQASVVESGCILLNAATKTQRETLIPLIASGQGIVVCALDDKPGITNQVEAKQRGIGYELSGSKHLTPYANACQHLIVSANLKPISSDDSEMALFVVAADAAGVAIESYCGYDGTLFGEVRLDGVRLSPEARMAAVAVGQPTLDLLRLKSDHSAAMLAVEASGLMWEVQRMTLDYLKMRHQFGQPLAKFQSLAHRAVDMYVQCQLAQSLAWDAVESIASPTADWRHRARRVSAAKSFIGTAGRMLGQEAVQLHGAIGMTDDYPIGHYLKRLTAIDVLEQNADWHRRRYQSLAK